LQLELEPRHPCQEPSIIYNNRVKKRNSINLLAKSRDFLHKKVWLFPIVDWLVLLTLIAFSWWLMSLTFGYEEGQFVMKSKLYSDFGAHLPLIRSFSQGANWPPEYPFFVGEPIRYHYFFYLIVGMLERVGLPIDLALNIPSSVGMTVLLFMVYKIALMFFKRRVIGVLAVILVLFNGSLAFVEYFNQQGWTRQALQAIPEQVHFASFGPWSGRLVAAFWNWNIFTNQRHLALGYGLVLVGMYPLLRVVFEKVNRKLKTHTNNEPVNDVQNWKILNQVQDDGDGSLPDGMLKQVQHDKLGLSVQDDAHQSFENIKNRFPFDQLILISIFAVLPLLHQASYLILLGLVIGWCVLYPRKTRRLWSTYLVAIVASLIVFGIFTAGSEQEWAWIFGYLSPDKSILGMLEYWGYNLGLYLILFPIVLIWSIWKKNYFLLLTSVFFVIANMMRLSTDMINNHKFINFFVMVLSLMTAGWLGMLWQKTKWSWPVVILIFVALTFSGVMDVFPVVNDYDGQTNDEPRSPIQAYIRQNTPPRSQFVTTTYMYNPASMAGRFLFLDYGYHAWSMGYQDRAKRDLLPQIFSPSIDQARWCRIVLPAGIDYVLLDPRPESVEDGRINVADSAIARSWQPEYSSPEGWRLYNVAKLCLPL